MNLFTRKAVDIGRTYEALACKYLQAQGLKLLEKNYRSRFGEIDLIMLDTDQLVFVEVRYREQSHFGSAAESITQGKQQKLVKTAQTYMQTHSETSRLATRFDVVAIEGNAQSPSYHWICNAFEA